MTSKELYMPKTASFFGVDILRGVGSKGLLLLYYYFSFTLMKMYDHVHQSILPVISTILIVSYHAVVLIFLPFNLSPFTTICVVGVVKSCKSFCWLDDVLQFWLLEEMKLLLTF
jgi:hypothetical protein